MKDKFPYQGNEVLITQEMCDLNEHMNVLYYAQIFEEEFPFYSSLGFSSNYFEQGFSFFTLEMNIRYLKEMRKGEVALPGFRYFAVKPKLIHYGGVIFNEAGDACAISEFLRSQNFANIHLPSIHNLPLKWENRLKCSVSCSLC